MMEILVRDILDYKTLESPLDIKPINPEGNKPWVFIGRTDAEAEAPIFWPDVKSRLIGKGHDTGKDWGQEEKGAIEDEMFGWHRLNGYEFEQALGAGDGQGILACCNPWRAATHGVLQPMASHRVGQDWATDQQYWTKKDLSMFEARWIQVLYST